MKKTQTVNNPSTPHSGRSVHIVADFYGCNNLTDNKFVQKMLLISAKKSNATILHKKFHQFDPQGLTGYILLSESHISIHTWPETSFAAVDVFTCGDTMDPQAAISYIKKSLLAKKAKIKVIHRETEIIPDGQK